MSKVIGALQRFVRTSFGAALAGGLVVAVVGLIAISAGWVKSSSSDSQATTLTASPLPQPAPRQASGKGLTVNQIYQQDSPGVAFIQAQSAPRPPSPLNPFGSGGGGAATRSGVVIDHSRPIPTHAHVVDGAGKNPGPPWENHTPPARAQGGGQDPP